MHESLSLRRWRSCLPRRPFGRPGPFWGPKSRALGPSARAARSSGQGPKVVREEDGPRDPEIGSRKLPKKGAALGASV